MSPIDVAKNAVSVTFSWVATAFSLIILGWKGICGAAIKSVRRARTTDTILTVVLVCCVVVLGFQLRVRQQRIAAATALAASQSAAAGVAKTKVGKGAAGHQHSLENGSTANARNGSSSPEDEFRAGVVPGIQGESYNSGNSESDSDPGADNSMYNNNNNNFDAAAADDEQQQKYQSPYYSTPQPPPRAMTLRDIANKIESLERADMLERARLRLRELEERRNANRRVVREYDFGNEAEEFREREREWQREKWDEAERAHMRWRRRARYRAAVDQEGEGDEHRGGGTDGGGGWVGDRRQASNRRSLIEPGMAGASLGVVKAGTGGSGGSDAEAVRRCPGIYADVKTFVSYREHASRSPQRDHAYVTYVSSSEFVPAAATLMYSIAQTGSRHARAILVTKDVPAKDRDALSILAQIIEIDVIPAPKYVENKRYRETFTKLRIWELTMFSKVIYIDTDVIVLRNMDDLFDLHEWSVPMDAEQNRYSTGMMICEPSLDTFDSMMKHLKETTVSMELPDLLFLKEYFEKVAPRRINIIPRWYQVYQEEFGSLYQTYLTSRKEKITIFDSRIHGIHYPGENKPWKEWDARYAKYSAMFCRWDEAEDFKYSPHFLWFLAHERMKVALAREMQANIFSFESSLGATVLSEYRKQREKEIEEEKKWRSSYGGYGSNNYNSNYNSGNANGMAATAPRWEWRNGEWVQVPGTAAKLGSNSDAAAAQGVGNAGVVDASAALADFRWEAADCRILVFASAAHDAEFHSGGDSTGQAESIASKSKTYAQAKEALVDGVARVFGGANPLKKEFDKVVAEIGGGNAKAETGGGSATKAPSLFADGGLSKARQGWDALLGRNSKRQQPAKPTLAAPIAGEDSAARSPAANKNRQSIWGGEERQSQQPTDDDNEDVVGTPPPSNPRIFRRSPHERNGGDGGGASRMHVASRRRPLAVDDSSDYFSANDADGQTEPARTKAKLPLPPPTRYPRRTAAPVADDGDDGQQQQQQQPTEDLAEVELRALRRQEEANAQRSARPTVATVIHRVAAKGATANAGRAQHHRGDAVFVAVATPHKDPVAGHSSRFSQWHMDNHQRRAAEVDDPEQLVTAAPPVAEDENSNVEIDHQNPIAQDETEVAVVVATRTQPVVPRRNKPRPSPVGFLDFSNVPPFFANLRQRWNGVVGDTYTWVVNFCTRTFLHPPGTKACGKPSFASQYSDGECRTNFEKDLTTHVLYSRQNKVVGVVFRSNVVIDNPTRTKWMEVVVRCDWTLPPHIVKLDTRNATYVVIETVNPPNDRLYHIHLRSRCACSNGCVTPTQLLEVAASNFSDSEALVRTARAQFTAAFDRWRSRIGYTHADRCLAARSSLKVCKAIVPPCEFSHRAMRCLPPQQEWILVTEGTARRFCNCSHVGGTDQGELTLPRCQKLAMDAGANVVNFAPRLDKQPVATQRKGAAQSTPAPAAPTNPVGCYYKRCPIAALIRGRPSTGRWTEHAKGFDIYMINPFADKSVDADPLSELLRAPQTQAVHRRWLANSTAVRRRVQPTPAPTVPVEEPDAPIFTGDADEQQ